MCTMLAPKLYCLSQLFLILNRIKKEYVRGSEDYGRKE
ncbi:hypothetical protein KP78_27700 [Jeotgalibacillus soli]|uniref:Uncharacterized protein n=1 Tax=Jeotgalibacillus soli TaxID=889306 RepID=A0A0C2VL86_9BACL|nr:hypothetical protein KP78_27700 [Jeotgalibacillus soli]